MRKREKSDILFPQGERDRLIAEIFECFVRHSKNFQHSTICDRWRDCYTIGHTSEAYFHSKGLLFFFSICNKIHFEPQEKYGQTGGIICIILLYISTALLYYTWGSAELQPWNATENEEYELEVPKVHDNAESQPESQPESESEPEPEPEPVELK